jgi:predicted MFS family arabinose efflux permease
MVIDIATFILAILALLLVEIPQPEMTGAEGQEQGGLWEESLYGFRYIFQRPSLLGLLLIFLAVNFIATFSFILIAPMILARTGNDEVILGSVRSAMGLGGVVGGLMLSVWGGFRRRIHGVLIGIALICLTGTLLLGLGRGLLVWALGAFFSAFFMPITNGSSQAIWQAKVSPEVQGRVFAVRRMIAQLVAPLSMVLAGPLADYVFEPAMSPEGVLADSLRWLVGTGPGAGMALMFVASALLGAMVALAGYLFPAVRNVEDLLPDHDQTHVQSAQTLA